MKIYLSTICMMFIFFHSENGLTQRSCRFNNLLREAAETDPYLPGKKVAFEKQINTFYEDLSQRKIQLPDTIFIPLVFHVLWHTPDENIIDSQIISQVRILNEDFRSLNADTVNTPPFFKTLRGKTNFYFVLARQDPFGLPTNGINRVYTYRKNGFALDGVVHVSRLGGQDAWDPRYYVNVWVCNMENASGTIGATYFPGGSLKRDGIMIDYRYLGTGGITQAPYNLGRTMTHEMGHYFNLDHTWGPTDISYAPFCGDDDHVDDTPPQSNANYYCPSFPRPSCKNISDMYMNYMDYVDDPCMNMFSKGQAERMLAAWYIMTPYLRVSKALNIPAPLRSNDAAIDNILMPVEYSFSCSEKTRVVLVLRNAGTDTISSVEIVTGITGDSSSINRWSLTSLHLQPGEKDTVLLPGFYSYPSTGSLSFYGTIVSVNSKKDDNTLNNGITVKVNIVGPIGRILPYYQQFNDIPFPPAGIGIENPDKLFTWTATNGSQLSGLAPSIMMNNREYPFAGRKDYLLLPPFSLDGSESPVIEFLHAFQLYDEGRRMRSDTLLVEVSTDCGFTWHTLFYKGGRQLATVKQPQRGYFSPDRRDQWQLNTLSLIAFRGMPNVWIRFGNISGKENLLYLDNIVVKDKAAVFSIPFVEPSQN
jgi:hypothetical protein